MTVFQFDSLTNNQSIAFDPAVDSLNFATNTAAVVLLNGTSANLRIDVGGKHIFLNATSYAQLTTTNVTFADGSVLYVGDNTTGVVNDDIGNNIALGANNNNNLIFGMLGDDTIVAGNGNNFIYGGRGAGDSLDGADQITVGTGSNTIYSNSGNDTVTLGSTLISNTNTVNLGQGDDSLTGGGAGNASVKGGAGADNIVLISTTGDITVIGGSSTTDTVSENDFIITGTGNSLVYGNGGDDIINALPNTGKEATIYGNDGDDSLYGDTVTGFTGSANVYGGSGTDLLDFSNESTASLNLFGDDGSSDSADGGDSIIADGGASVTVHGGGGNDNIYIAPGTGNDALVFGEQGDDYIWDSDTSFLGTAFIYGGAGSDSIDMGDSDGDITVYGGASAGDTIAGENDTIIAGDGSAVIFGNGGDDSINIDNPNVSETVEAHGNRGNDTIDGDASAANTSAFGGQGNDSIVTGSGNDTVVGGEGNDFLNAAGGTLNFVDAGNGDDTVIANAVADTLLGGGGTDLLDNVGDTLFLDGTQLSSFENIRIKATGANVGFGSSYAATLESGNLTVDGSNATSAVTVAGALVSADMTIYGGSNSDTLVGGFGDNSIDGGGGNDTIQGGGSGNNLYGNGGNDIITFTDTVDTLGGGSGTDTLTGVFGTVNFEGTLRSSFEHIILANTLSATLTFTTDYENTLNGSPLVIDGSALVGNTLNVNGGTILTHAMSITGGSGADTITGSDQNDTITGGNGADLLNGSDGNDSFIYTDAQLDLAIDTVNGGDDSSGDVIFVSNSATIVDASFVNMTNIEGLGLNFNGGGQSVVVGANAQAAGIVSVDASALSTLNTSTVSINASAYTVGIAITGGAGNDTLTGGTVDDTIVGGAGNDSITAGAGADSINGAEGLDTILAAVADITGLEESIDGGDDVDHLTITNTGAVNLTLATISNVEVFDYSAAGNNVTMLAAQVDDFDSITGGAGADTLTFDDSGTVDLSGTALTSVATLVFDAAGNNLIVNVADIADVTTFTGGAGTDTITLDDNAALYDFSGKTLTSINTFVFDSAGDTLVFSSAQIAGVTTFTGGAGTDVIAISASGTLDVSGKTLTSIDTLLGSGGADTIIGGTESLTFQGGAGADRLTGGGGNDRFVFTDTSDAGDVITDFFFANFTPPGRDVISFHTSGGSWNSLNMSNYVEGAPAVAQDNSVIVLTSANFANFAAAEAAIEGANAATTDYLVVFYNSTSNRVEAYFDTSSAVGSGTFMFALNGYTDASDLALLSANNFEGF